AHRRDGRRQEPVQPSLTGALHLFHPPMPLVVETLEQFLRDDPYQRQGGERRAGPPRERRQSPDEVRRQSEHAAQHAAEPGGAPRVPCVIARQLAQPIQICDHGPSHRHGFPRPPDGPVPLPLANKFASQTTCVKSRGGRHRPPHALRPKTQDLSPKPYLGNTTTLSFPSFPTAATPK